MANRIAIRCKACGCETILDNIQPGVKVFCLHCGRKITDSYQQGMESELEMEYQQIISLQQNNMPPQETEFIPPPQQTSIPEENVVPPPIVDSYKQTEYFSEPPLPDWKTEPYIRINWKRIEFTITTTFNRIVSFISNCLNPQGRNYSSSTPPNESYTQYEEPLNNPPVPDTTEPPLSPEPEMPFGYVDRRQERIEQSFSRTFADSDALPAPPSNTNYTQQRIDQSYSNSFADSGAIPASPSNTNYSQQRIDQSFTKSFADSGAIPASLSNTNYSQQRIDQSFTKSFREEDNKQA